MKRPFILSLGRDKPRKCVVDLAVLGTRGFPSHYGGFETLLRWFIPHALESNLSVRVYCRKTKEKVDSSLLSKNLERKFTLGLNSRGLSTITYGFTSFFHCILNPPRVALIMNLGNGLWLPLCKVFGVPTVVNVDGLEWQRDKWNGFVKKFLLWNAKLCAKYADVIVADSLEIQRVWKVKFSRESIYIPYGPNVATNENSKAEKVLGILPYSPYILYVARFERENSTFEFLEACKLLKGINIIVVGSGEAKLEEIAQSLNEKFSNFTWLGHVKDDLLLDVLWEHAAIYFHGHTVGGTNPALLSAMENCSTIIAIDTPFNREVLGEAGAFTNRDVNEIVKDIKFLLDRPDDMEKYSKKAKARVASLYSWGSVNELYINLIKSLFRS